MKKISLSLALVVVMALGAGCWQSTLSEEKKLQISEMKSQIQKLEMEIGITEREIKGYGDALIPTLKKARIEVDKLTIAVLRQHIAGIESGAKISIVVPATKVDLEILPALEEEIKQKEIDIAVAEKEASSAGGMYKVVAESLVATEKILLANLEQKYLQAKYGLNVPALTSHKAAKEQIDGVTMSNKDETPLEPEKREEIQDAGPFDFRRTRWGMSPEDVKARESATLIHEGAKGLSYTDSIEGMNVSVSYLFYEGKLWRCGYTVSENYSNKNKYVDAYHILVETLKGKYGNPTSEETFWSDSLYKGDYENRGMAYAIGDVQSITTWNKDGTSVFIKIDGNNFNIDVSIIYSNDELEAAFREKEKQEQQSKL